MLSVVYNFKMKPKK